MVPFKQTHEFVAHAATVNCLAFGPESHQVVATGGEDRKVNLWRVTNVGNFWSLSGHTSAVQCLCFDPQETYVVSGSQGGSLKVYDLEVGKIARNLTGHMSAVTCINYHPYGEFLVSGSADTNLKIWDLRTKKCVLTYKGHSMELTDAKFTPDGQWCATSGKDGALTIWDLKKKEVIHTFKLDSSAASITHFEFNPNELLVAAATSERVVRIWDSETFELVATSNPEPHPVRAMVFDPSGERLYTASEKSLRILGGKNGRMLQHMETGWEKIAAVTLTKEEHLIAGSFQSQFVSIWSTAKASSSPSSSSAAALSLPSRSNSSSSSRSSSSSSSSSSKQGQISVTTSSSTVSNIPESTRRGRVASAPSAAPSPREAGRGGGVEAKGAKEGSSSGDEKEGGWWVGVGEGDENRNVIPAVPLQQQRYQVVAQAKRIPGGSDSAAAAAAKEGSMKEVSSDSGGSLVNDANGTRSNGIGEAKGGDGSTSRGSGQLQQQHYEAKASVIDRPITSSSSLRGNKPRARESSSVGEGALATSQKKEEDGDDQFFATDNEVIINTLLYRTTLTSTLSTRLTQLQLLATMWSQGNVSGAFALLRQLYDGNLEDRGRLTVLADFLRVIDLKSEGISLEASIFLLPILVSLLTLEFENHVMVGLRGLETVLALFGQYVKQFRTAVPLSGGVDLSREERMKKCDKFHQGMMEAQEKIGDLGRAFKPDSAVHPVLSRFQRQVEGYMNRGGR